MSPPVPQDSSTSIRSPTWAHPISGSDTDGLDPPLGMLLISVVGITLLVPLFFALCFTIPIAKRRTILYSTLFLAVVAALSEGALSIYLQDAILRRHTIAREVALEITLIALIMINPIISQCVVFSKIYTLYPMKVLSYKLIAAIYIPAVAIKAARIVLVALTVHTIVKTPLPAHGAALGVKIWSRIWHISYANGVWCVQLADDIFSTIVLASRLIRGPQQGIFNGPRGDPEQSRPRFSTLAVTIACTCIVPVLMDVAEVILSCLPGPDKGNYAGIYAVLASSFVEVICTTCVVMCYEHLSIRPLPPRTATSPVGVPRTTAFRLISPLAKLPRIQLFQSSTDSLGSVSSTGSAQDSATMYNSDRSESFLAKKKYWDTYALPSHVGTRFEPSVISGCGTIQAEGSEDQVFYAI
ncbi:hypothetical protein GY45DRAFT_1375689 [Cubamyces sp. BRFM 1775]|nr:hypothetical protein GY45DRAFT_1375689 [Cubamyces sp. BRFM 1775]